MIRLVPTSLVIAILVASSTASIASQANNAAFAADLEKRTSDSLPGEVRIAAINSLDHPSGEIAGAKVGNSDTYVVFVRTNGLCGSGGCRAQIWARTSTGLVQKAPLPVGHLPIVRLPESDMGMPLLGVTVYPSIDSEGAILPVAFDGTDYTLSDWENLLPRDAGEPIITSEMMTQF